MKKIISLVLVFSALQSFSQGKASVELNYPIPTGDNFVSNYKGILDIGFKYRFAEKEDFTFGVSLNANHLTYSKDYQNIRFKTKNYNIQPRFFAELKLKGAPRFHPALGLGYTFMQFSSKGSSIPSSEDPMIIDESQNLSGLNYNISFSFDFAKKFYAQAQYDGIKIGSTPEGVPDTKYNTTANFIKLGVGYRF
ncbi:MAG: outer membrane beta-barrel protein [Flavobacterium sp.]|nr:outer membrane beta-barrel protein [Flavobacterium sp.]